MMQVLIVDDDPAIRETLCAFLQRTGWDVKAAGDFESGMKMLDEDIDVVLTDIRLGDESGIDLLRAARAEHPFIEVILMTGHVDIKDPIEALNLRAFAYLTKPFEFSELNQTLISAASTKALNQREAYYKKTLEHEARDKTRQLSVEKEKLRAIFDATPSLLIVLDKEMKIHDCNLPFEKLTGVAARDAVGCQLCLYVCGDHERCECSGGSSPREQCILYRMVNDIFHTREQLIRGQTNLVVDPGGRRERRTIRASSCLLPVSGGESQVLLMLDDITREKEMEAQLVHSGRMSALGQMASGVAHELNQPLNAIATYIQLLQSRIAAGKPTSVDEMSSIYGDLLQEVRRMSDIIDHLRIFQRSGRLPDGGEPLMLDEIFESAVKLSRTQIGKQGITLEESFAGDLPPVSGDRSRLEQMFINLVLNARDALVEQGAERGVIRVDCCAAERDKSAGVQITVSDNGPGIPPENLEKIFDPFFTSKDPDKGTGLGLAICYQAVIDMGGTIEVQSEPGAGTDFLIWLPAAGDGAPQK